MRGMMSNVKTRKKVLEKIAQAVPSTTPPPASVSPPPTFQASLAYPNIRTGYNGSSINTIDQLVTMLNTATHYATGGKVNFQTLKNSNFSLDMGAMPSKDGSNLIKFSQQVFKNLLNGGAAYAKPLTGIEVAGVADRLASSQELSNLSLSPSGPVAQKVPGNLKTNITTLLNYLKLANPIQAT